LNQIAPQGINYKQVLRDAIVELIISILVGESVDGYIALEKIFITARLNKK